MPRPLSSRPASSVARVASVAAAFAGLATAPSSVQASLWDWTSVSESVTSAALTEGLWDTYVTLPDSDTANPDVNWHNERNPVHGALLRNPLGSKGKVLMFRHFKWFIAELDTAATLRVEDIGTYWDQGPWPFCGGHSVMPDGKLLISGGDHSYYDNPVGYPVKSPADSVPEFVPDPWASTFDPYDNEYAVIDSMLGLPRWYPTNVLMPDGSTWVVAGDFWDVTKDTVNVGHPNNGEFTNVIPWIRWDGSTWEEVDPEPLGWNDEEDHARATTPLYPFFHVMPSGLFYAGAQHGDSLYASCEVCKSRLWAWEDAWPSFDAGAPSIDDRVYNHDHGICVQLTLAPPYYDAFGGSERVLLAGGGRQGHSGQQMPPYPDAPNLRGPHPMAEIFEGGASPSWTAIDPMLYPRKEANGTLLPDGRVFVSGGHYVANPCFDLICDIGTNVGNSPVLESEMFDPADDSWAEMDDLTFSYGRKYHSFALLLPDARVLTAGNQNLDDSLGAGQNYEIYYPPYLFVDDDPVRLRTASERPEIAGVDSTIAYGFPFFVEFDQVSSPDSVQACLIAPSAVTHGNNMTQRRVLLDCEPAVVDGDTLLAVTAPWEPEIAPPGYYLLFLLEGGIPSEAAWVKLQQPDYVVGSGETEIWAGPVHLDRDFTVEEGGLLRILPGARIFAWAGRDSGGTGDPDLVEGVIRGQFVAEGTAQDPIEFASHLGTGGWGGLRFELEGCYRTGYGYAGVTQPLSSIKHAKIKDAAQGILIADHGVPNLEAVEFENITGDRHIVLEADAVIPYGYWTVAQCDSFPFVESPGRWNLRGGTHVVASTTVTQDASWIGQTNRNDLIAYGDIVTEGSAATGDQVFFRPDVPTPLSLATAGDDWGGLFLTKFTRGSRLRWADIGFAANPVYIDYPDSLNELSNSRIHSFADVGIWVHGARGVGGIITGCIVDRVDSLRASLGGMGVYLDQADDFELLDTQILLHGRNDAAGSAGISIGYGKTFSESAPQDAQFLVVRENFVMGPGVEVGVGDLPDTGMETYWVCGRTAAPLRSIEISENWIEGWSAEGMEFTQSADIQVSCNRVVASRDGVEVDRDTLPPNVPIRFRENQFEVLTRDPDLATFRTNDAANVKLGPDQADRGANRLTVHFEDTMLLYESDAGLSDILDARDGFWFKDSSDVRILLAEEDSITVRISSPDTTFDISGFAVSDAEPECEAVRPESAPSGTVRGAGRSVQVVDGPSASGGPVTEVPLKLELGRPMPNPSTGAMTVTLAVPADRIGRYVFEVFDVRGRRVVESREHISTPGRHGWSWSNGDGGGRAAAGIYFLRVRGPGGFLELRKITVLR